MIVERDSGTAVSSGARILEISLFVIGALIAGVTGILTIGVLFWLSDRQAGRDQVGKHGISNKLPSRLGGIAVLVSALIVFVSGGLAIDGVPTFRFSQYFSTLELAALLIGLVGLSEDITQSLSASSRLALLFLIVLCCLVLRPDIVPVHLAASILPEFVDELWVMGPLTLVFVVGFVNAGNIADGANGLVPLIFAPLFFAVFLTTKNPLVFSVLLSLTVFAAFNLVTGRIILGDMGSYTLSALCCFWCLDLYQHGSASVWFFGAMLSYPCVEFVVSFTRRLWGRQSPMRADNHHLHNRIHRCFLHLGVSELFANSLTGLVVAGGSAGPAFCFYVIGLSLDSPLWGLLFACQVLLLLFLTEVLSRIEKRFQGSLHELTV